MPQTAAPAAPVSRTTHFRWVICGLLFAATTINYVDRAAFGMLAPKLKEIFHWDDSDISSISLWFEISYAIGLAFAGRILDRVGTKLGLGVAFAAWCLASMLHAGMTTVLGFKFARFLLGLPEAGAWPGVNKATAEWFPRRERAVVAGVYNAGSNVGSMIVPLVAPWLLLRYGWQVAFLALGAAGFVWLFFWFLLYRLPAQHPGVSPGELAHIVSDPPDTVTEIMPVARILATRAAWAFIMGKLFTDMVFRWFTYLLPTFLTAHFHLDIRSAGWPLFTIWLMASFGSIGGGALSSLFLKLGWSLNAARKTAMLVSVICVLPVMLTTQISSVWLGVLIVGLMLAAHQSWSSNLYTSVSDMFPKHAVGAVSGYGGTAGAVGATALLFLTSSLFDARKNALAAATAAVASAKAGVDQAALGAANAALDAAKANADHVYTVIFVIAGFAYLIAFACFHLLVPRMEPVKKE
jgi:ACS family hexuronate transporter-like MFS transporter